MERLQCSFGCESHKSGSREALTCQVGRWRINLPRLGHLSHRNPPRQHSVGLALLHLYPSLHCQQKKRHSCWRSSWPCGSPVVHACRKTSTNCPAPIPILAFRGIETTVTAIRKEEVRLFPLLPQKRKRERERQTPSTASPDADRHSICMFQDYSHGACHGSHFLSFLLLPKRSLPSATLLPFEPKPPTEN